jgi:hypothetical protein
MKRFVVLFSIVGLFAAVAGATPAIGKKESKPCTTCHVKQGAKDLNNVGKFYKEKKTLEGAPAPEAPKK